MNIWISDMIGSWGTVAAAIGIIAMIAGVLLVANEYISSIRERAESRRRLNERIRKYTRQPQVTD